jgi:hypothetical protein
MAEGPKHLNFSFLISGESRSDNCPNRMQDSTREHDQKLPSDTGREDASAKTRKIASPHFVTNRVLATDLPGDARRLYLKSSREARSINSE